MYSGITGCIRQSGCIRAKIVEFGQKWLYSEKSGCLWEKVVLFRKSDCDWAKVVVTKQSGCIRDKIVFSTKSGCIPAKVVEFGQGCSTPA